MNWKDGDGIDSYKFQGNIFKFNGNEGGKHKTLFPEQSAFGPRNESGISKIRNVLPGQILYVFLVTSLVLLLLPIIEFSFCSLIILRSFYQ